MENKKNLLLIISSLVLSWAVLLNIPKKPLEIENKGDKGKVLGLQINARGNLGPKLEEKINFLPALGPEDLAGIKAKSFLVFDLQSSFELAEKESGLRLPIASLTKLMTGYLTYEKLDFSVNGLIEPKTYWNFSPKLGLKTEDKIKIEDLFNSMLVGSANDAAFALADSYTKTVGENFVEAMNKKAKQFGMFNTSFSNPAGYDSKDNFSTASDLKLMISQVYSLPEFRNLSRKTEYAFNSLNNKTYKIKATNKLLDRYEDLSAIKTGYTKNSLGSMATVLEAFNRQIVLLVLDSPQREKDTLIIRQAILGKMPGPVIDYNSL